MLAIAVYVNRVLLPWTGCELMRLVLLPETLPFQRENVCTLTAASMVSVHKSTQADH